MPPLDPDTGLRRMIARLAALHVKDVVEILGALGSQERPVAEELLKEYAGSFGVDAPLHVRDSGGVRLSSWLTRRLDRPDISGAQGPRITLHACEALRNCIENAGSVRAASRGAL